MKFFIKIIYFNLLKRMPFFKIIYYTKNTQTPVTWKMIFFQKVLGFNRKVPWPVHHNSTVSHPQNITVGIDVCPGYSRGCYIQGSGKLSIGDYTQIAPNVGIITSNHDAHDTRKHITSYVNIGSYGWIGMNSMILPNVELGDFVIVGAGSIVTKSFIDGYCIIAGNPAKIIRKLDKEECIRFENEYKHLGYKLKKESNDCYL